MDVLELIRAGVEQSERFSMLKFPIVIPEKYREKVEPYLEDGEYMGRKVLFQKDIPEGVTFIIMPEDNE